MPEEEKKEHIEEYEKHKKFKAVTEELSSSLPSVSDSSQNEDKKDEEKIDKPEDSGIVVPETKNIDTTAKLEEKGIFLKFFLVTFLGTLFALLLAGGVYVYFTGTKTTNKVVENTPIPSMQPTSAPSLPAASPSGNVDLSTYKISVLNGNGGIGVASALKAIIEKVGFKVSNLANADNFGFTNTLIQTKTSVPQSVVDTLKNSLSSNYSVSVGSSLDPASTYDIVITVGSK